MARKRIFAFLCVAMLLASILAGCGNKVSDDLVGKWCMMTVDYEVVDFMGFEFREDGTCNSFVGDSKQYGVYEINDGYIDLTYNEGGNTARFEYKYEDGEFMLKLELTEHWGLRKMN